MFTNPLNVPLVSAALVNVGGQADTCAQFIARRSSTRCCRTCELETRSRRSAKYTLAWDTTAIVDTSTNAMITDAIMTSTSVKPASPGIFPGQSWLCLRLFNCPSLETPLDGAGKACA